MEGLSGEGTRRRREYIEDTEVREPTIEDIERAKERALERIDASRESEVSAREYVHQAVREVLEEDRNEERISREVKDAIEDLERMEEFRESIERRKEEALERIDLSRREVMEDSPEEQEETEESRFEDIRSQEEREAEIARKLDEALEELEKMERPEVSEPKEVEEGDISGKVKDAIEDLERLERVNESTEDKSRDALESIDEQEGGQEGKILADEATENTEKLERSEDNEETTASEIEKRLEKRDEKSLTREAPSRIQELDQSWVKDVISDEDSKEWNKESLVEDLRKISHNLPDTSSTFYIDVEKSLGVSSWNLSSFEQAFHQVRESFDEIEGVRFGLAGERLYVWKPEFDSSSLESAYDSLYYYFRDKEAFDKYIDDVGEALGFQSKSETLKHLRELVPQMIVEDSCDNCINPQLRRIRGDFVNLMNDISGKNLSDLDDEVSRLTKTSGKGGIANPRFPKGEKYEIALSRLTAIAISDCHLKPNGTLEYAESEMSRIKIVERELQAFGEIKINPKFREHENLYISYFPTPLGVMLEHFGIPSGDRSVQNPGLFSTIKEFSPRARCALIEDLIPQDGTVSGKRIQWTHSNILDSPRKNDVYGIESKIGEKEIGLIKEQGKREQHSWVLSYGKLKELRNSDSENVQQAAQDLWKCVYDNRNRLIRDEIEVVRSLEVEYQAKPYAIRYHIRTGRVSVAWTAVPKGLRESIKLGMIAPPNDEIKRGIVKEIIRSHQQHVEDELRRFKDHGVEVDKWWGVEE